MKATLKPQGFPNNQVPGELVQQGFGQHVSALSSRHTTDKGTDAMTVHLYDEVFSDWPNMDGGGLVTDGDE